MKLSVVTYLTICLIEECAEIIQRACKALRFGWYEVQPEQDLNNVDRLSHECSDLIGVVEMLNDRDIPIGADSREIMAKREKVTKFMDLSRELGILNIDADRYWCKDCTVEFPASLGEVDGYAEQRLVCPVCDTGNLEKVK